MNTFKNLWPWALTVATLTLLYTRRDETRRGLHQAADLLGDTLESVSESVDPWLESAGKTVGTVQKAALPAARHAFSAVSDSVHDVVTPLAKKAGNFAEDALEWGSHALEDFGEWREDAAKAAAQTAQQAAHLAQAKGHDLVRDAALWEGEAARKGGKFAVKAVKQGKAALKVGAEVATGLLEGGKALGKAELGKFESHKFESKRQKAVELMEAKMVKELVMALKGQQKAIGELGSRVDSLARSSRHSGGGFPWGLVMLGAGAYYLYKNPSLLNRGLELIGKASPSAKEHLEHVGQTFNEGVNRVQRGENLGDVVRDAAQGMGKEVSEAAKDAGTEAKKAVDSAGDAAEDMAKDARQAAQGAADKAKDAYQSVAGQAKDAARDVGDKAKDAAREMSDKAREAARDASGPKNGSTLR
ncbi:MAG: hypothetical protein H7095_00260 [Pseudopedobacter sp.]|nr:hypothetical protein [Deinococcales bacterium]